MIHIVESQWQSSECTKSDTAFQKTILG